MIINIIYGIFLIVGNDDYSKIAIDNSIEKIINSIIKEAEEGIEPIGENANYLKEILERTKNIDKVNIFIIDNVDNKDIKIKEKK